MKMKWLFFLSGSKSNGQQAEVFRIEELPGHGSLRDTNSVMVEPESLPFILSSHQVFIQIRQKQVTIVLFSRYLIKIQTTIPL